MCSDIFFAYIAISSFTDGQWCANLEEASDPCNIFKLKFQQVYESLKFRQTFLYYQKIRVHELSRL